MDGTLHPSQHLALSGGLHPLMRMLSCARVACKLARRLLDQFVEETLAHMRGINLQRAYLIVYDLEQAQYHRN